MYSRTTSHLSAPPPQADTIHGTDGNDSLLAGANGGLLFGHGGDDTLRGAIGGDALYGGTGADLLDGGAGNDLLSDEDGHDTLLGGAGDDWLYGGSSLVGGDGDDILFSYQDTATRMDGGAGRNTAVIHRFLLQTGLSLDLSSGAGLLTGGAVTTALRDFDLLAFEGGSGDDFVTATAGDDVLVGHLGNDTLRGGAGHDVITGNEGDDSLAGGDGNDRLEGYQIRDSQPGGDDTLRGGNGNDSMVGHEGNDRLFGGSGDDLLDAGKGEAEMLDGGAGTDHAVVARFHLIGGMSLDLSTGSGRLVGGGFVTELKGIESIELSLGRGNNRVTATAGDDTIYGNLQADSLAGGTGDDRLYGGDGGADSLFGGAGDDWLVDAFGASRILDGGDGFDVVIVDHQNMTDGIVFDLLTGSATLAGDGFVTAILNVETLGLTSGAGDDRIRGTRGEDGLDGQAGNDSLLGAAGGDFLHGGRGRDTLRGGADGDFLLSGGGGEDLVDGGDGNDLLRGMPGDDRLIGRAGNDTMEGGQQDDRLFGGAGNDRLWGNAGRDTLTGGQGQDRFGFHLEPTSGEWDILTDFDPAQDTIRLHARSFTGMAEGALAAGVFAATADGAAQQAGQRLLYATETGALYFDRDGSGAVAAVQFAQLSPGLALAAEDFFLF